MLNWLEISRKELKGNVRRLRKTVGAKCDIMAVVKANAYGHGMVEVSKNVLDAGASQLAVVKADEALELREAGVGAPILVLGYVEDDDYEKLIKNRVRMCLYDINIAKHIDVVAGGLGMRGLVDVKIDTGMNRFGFGKEEIVSCIQEIVELKNLKIETIYSHFANEESEEFSRGQIDNMNEALKSLRDTGIRMPLVHMNKSKTVLEWPEAQFDMVRIGGLLYGLVKDYPDFKPVMKFKAKVANIKKLKTGEYVGYRGAYQSKSYTKVALVTAGYADGYSRLMSNKGRVTIGGVVCPVVGQICMSQTFVDITTAGDVNIGDDVTIFGDDKVSVFEVAETMKTVPYEVTTRMSTNMKRVYVD